jgi:hypothetical protein
LRFLKRPKDQGRSGLCRLPGQRNPKRQIGNRQRCHHSSSFIWRISEKPEKISEIADGRLQIAPAGRQGLKNLKPVPDRFKNNKVELPSLSPLK